MSRPAKAFILFARCTPRPAPSCPAPARRASSWAEKGGVAQTIVDFGRFKGRPFEEVCDECFGTRFRSISSDACGCR
jgi:hypothetical protein